MNATKWTLLAPVALAFFVGCAGGVDDDGTGIRQDPAVAGQAAEEEALDECQWNETQACEDENGVGGMQTCEPGEEGYVWSACSVASSSSSTPLVLSFDGARVDMSSAASGSFDLAGVSASIGTDWPAARTPWLALDRNGNGVIDDGSELFGSMTQLSSGERASNGFVALRELDSDGDGRITPLDARFSELTLWSDSDQNRVSSAGELRSLASVGVDSIALDYRSARHCDARGNCEVERAGFSFSGTDGRARTGAVVDIHLRHR